MTDEYKSDWKYDEEKGVWRLETDALEINVSFWSHLKINESHIACIRWKYQDNFYATYIKIHLEDGCNEEDLLINASGFMTNWLAEQNDSDNTSHDKKAS
jgi:hypothetical protein